MKGDLVNAQIHCLGFGGLAMQMGPMVHGWRNVRRTTSTSCVQDLNKFLVYRVSWLRAKARFNRWSEELEIVGHEMKWTVNWFRWKEEQWRLRLHELDNEERPPGLDCYCHKQMALWSALADQAQTQFTNTLG